jgi:4-hydroxybenzoate polyprenyltransferase
MLEGLSMRAYLQLLRLPTVFTAMADVLLGFQLTHRSFEPWPKLVGLMIASACLYLAGMVFNDVFDVAQDTRERPDRPIPSGRVSRRAATLLGIGLMVVGMVAAWTVAEQSLVIAAALVVAILAYDRFLKRTPLGPVGMGLCRGLNLMLGASDYSLVQYNFFWAQPQLPLAGALAIYIAGVTWFARTEAKESSRGALTGALLVMDAGLGLLMWYTHQRPGEGRADLTLMLLGLIAASLNGRAMGALSDPSPARVQGLIKLFLLNYVTICAALAYWHTGNGMTALIIALLVLPAMLLARLIAMT